MILVTTKFDVRPNKRKELVQTVRALAERTRMEAGCLSVELYIKAGNDNNLCLLEEWGTQADLDKYLRSQNFNVLCGAVKALNAEAEMRVQTVRKL